MIPRPIRALAPLLGALAGLPSLQAQSTPADVVTERAAYVEWLTTAANSPLVAVAQQPIGTGLRLGPDDADIPLSGVPEHRVTVGGGSVRLEGPEGSRVLPRGRPVELGRYGLAAAGAGERAVLTVFADTGTRKSPSHFDYDPALAFEGTLAPPDEPGTVRVLAVDGTVTEAAEAGTVTVPVGGARVRLRVRRIATSVEESDLEIFFRDDTNGAGTYPAGRFVSLVPLGGDRYRLDFNRARNPFCAYSSAYPCPAPWSGNTIPAPVRAGERYAGGGLDVPPGAGAPGAASAPRDDTARAAAGGARR
ncbi:MAG TPA: DUF1684 domain-containing protein [Gemmatimonadales bacterium]|nr:DUF1684 domain-containing protein [Gemmatimonadales bacterium]